MIKRRLVGLLLIVFILISASPISAQQNQSSNGKDHFSNGGAAVWDDMRIKPSLTLDQAQVESDYGFWFDDEVIRWQEFIPTLDNLQEVNVYIGKTGSPGDVIVEIRDESGLTVIDTITKAEGVIPSGVNWVNFNFAQIPSLSLTPGNTYRIYVYSSADSLSPDNRYNWKGYTASTYCPNCDNDNTGSWPDYDYAFKTYGYGVRWTEIADFDGCGDSDLSVFKVEPWGGMWYLHDMDAQGWGNADSIPVPGDYDGDGREDVAVYNDGTWYVKDQFVDTWGDANSIPVVGEYDTDKGEDIAVFKVEAWGGTWYIKDLGTYGWGDSDSIPVPGDYDGDGITDIAVYNDGTWYVKDQFVENWGDASSIPVPGDYDGDGTTDLAVFKVEAWGGMWYIKDQAAYGYGNSDSIPVPGDYNGDGTTDVAVYNDGTWYVMNQFVNNWGDAGSYPLPAPDTNGDGDPYQ